jgi:hypothetical protein
VRKEWPDGHVTTIAGTGVAGYSGDGGPASQATLNFVHSAAPTSDGGYLIADTMNCVIRKISSNGTISTVAGNGACGYAGDGGPATQAAINNPRGVAPMPDGGFIFPDTNNQRVRRVWPDGTITTVAGNGVQGFSGDGGQATAAEFSIPFAVAPTPDGGFLVIDAQNQRIRKVSAAGIVTTVAGNGIGGYAGDGGPATSAEIWNPHNLAAMSDGSFLIADASNNRVRLVAADGTISTVFGTGTAGYSGDGGPAVNAQLSVPKAVAVTSGGNILVADEQNSMVRFAGTLVQPSNATAPTMSGDPNVNQTLTGTSGTWSGTGPTFAYQWRRCDGSGAACVDIAGATAKTYTVTAGDQGTTIRIQVTASNSAGVSTSTSSQSSLVGAPPTAPANTGLPVISGTPTNGQTLTTSDGTWSGTTPITFSYQWRRCNASGGSCAPIAGATSKSYTLVSGDVGSTIRASVTATNAAGSSSYSGTVSSAAPLDYWRLGDTSTTAVDATGSSNGTYVASPLEGSAGLVPGEPDTAVTLNGLSQYVEVPANSAWTTTPFSFEAIVRPSSLPDNRTIAAAQSSLTGWWLNTDVNGALRFFIGDGTAWRYAAPAPPLAANTTYDIVATYDGIAARLYVNGALVSTGPNATIATNIDGDPLRFGSASSFIGQFWPGVLDEAAFYSIALTAAQVSAQYNALQTGKDVVSAQTGIVAAAAATPPSNSGVPVVSGVAQAGQTLSASTGSWSGTAPLSYAYQWQRCGASCVNVGSNQATYLLASADVGSKMQVVVTASNSAGSASATSAQTGVVAAQATSGTLTVSVASGVNDGEVDLSGAQSAGYPPTGTASVNAAGKTMTAGRRLAFNSYGVYVPLLRFDTSGLPAGATVTSATLKLYVNKWVSADGRNLVAEWAPSAVWPLAPSDWTLSSTASALAGVPVSSLPSGAVVSLPLTGLANVSGTGYSSLRLHLDGAQPSGDNYVQFASFEDGNSPAAQLVLNWTTS